MSTELKQTKSTFKIEGKVAGIESEFAFREGYTQSDKEYKSIGFFVESSPVNRTKVELFGMERDVVYAYSSKAKQSKQISWADRNKVHGDYKVMGTTLYLEKGEDGKNSRKVLPEFDAVQYIKEQLKDGDSVRVVGEIDYQQYEVEGNVKKVTKFTIKSVSKIEDIDFSAEGYKEVAQFSQEIVAVDSTVNREEKQLEIDARIIKYGGEWLDTMFVVDAEKYPKLANAMSKRLKFGDFIKVYGQIWNLVLTETDTEEVETVVDEDDWGGDTEIANSFQNSYIKTYISKLEVTSVESASYEPKMYTEDDFAKSDDEAIFDGDFEDFDDELPF